ncbi:MAG TPA: methyltransferase domain-containing protein [Anaerolineales bacterium]|nr:methyltransferase domain-containing protein [Anaerolineales bacterium]HNN12360.1 methyltransferase domain-containing protein [Anaerolineales bacterium]HNO31421.1 methyltransferase domain-containing protein [Anaerolineales bacterium]
MGIERHRDLIDKNQELWHRKPLLRTVYTDLYRNMQGHLSHAPGMNVELGSGMGSIREVMPDCLRTDLFHYSWLDLVENAYCLSFKNGSLSNLLMVDVFHHLRYPGNALDEFLRVLAPGGRVILMEPGLGLLGRVIYEWMHVEPVGHAKDITWIAPEDWSPNKMDYYAAQGNATWIFTKNVSPHQLSKWNLVTVKRFAALAYAASGGYSGPQLYPAVAYPLIKSFEKFLQLFPALFTTRLMIVLEKSSA